MLSFFSVLSKQKKEFLFSSRIVRKSNMRGESTGQIDLIIITSLVDTFIFKTSAAAAVSAQKKGDKILVMSNIQENDSSNHMMFQGGFFL